MFSKTWPSLLLSRHSRESGNPAASGSERIKKAIKKSRFSNIFRLIRPADAGRWIPAFAGMTLVFFFFPFPALAVPQEGIAMHGAPKYGPGFAHFDYVNPDAPKGGTLHLGVAGSFDSLNPFIVRGNVPAAPAFSLFSSAAVYESLMARSADEPFSLYGLIAQNVEMPADRSEIVFNLRKEAHWQDGKPITADDVLFSFETLLDKGRPNHRTFYKKVARAEKRGESAVRFVFKKEANGMFDLEMPLIMGLMPILPKHIWQGKAFNQTSLELPVASGPYKITTVDPGRSLTLTRDLDYWGKDLAVQKGLYNFDTVKIDYYRDDGVAMEAFLSGAYDVRRENDPKKWVKMKEHLAVKDGRIVAELFAHQRPEAITGFVLNLRRPLFQDAALRQALAMAFDFEWINKALLYGMGKRTESFFPNSELAASVHKKSVFSQRDRLLEAADMLNAAGYKWKDGTLMTRDGTPVSFEIMLGDPAEEKIALEWTRGLQRLGITARVRTVDSAQYQERLNGFDYDVARVRWVNSLSPGNEQMNYWSCAAAKTNGSRNYMGLCDPEIDRLAAAIPSAKTRAELVETARKLDRLLMDSHTVVPFYYFGSDLLAYTQEKLAHPPKPPLYGAVLESWWAKGL